MTKSGWIAAAFFSAVSSFSLADAPKQKAKIALETGAGTDLGVVYKSVGQRELAFDVYYPPERTAKPYPVLVYTHGGGWAAGSRFGASKGLFAPLFQQLVQDGFCVVSVDYRLYKKGGSIRMRDCVIDSKDAVRYLAKNCERFGIDPERILVFGDSAGGHIAQMLLLSPPESLTGDPGLAEVDYTIAGGLSWYGPCDFEKIDLFNHDDRPDFRDRFGIRITGEDSDPNEKKRLYREMSPVSYLKRDSPPLMMIQGDQDTTIPVKHARHMEKRAKELGAPVETLIVKNSGHNWRMVGAEIEPSKQEIIRASAEFFRREAEVEE
ncbi:MAG: alpha/beta hydrolase [Verrucomicrobiales bacterium]|nr:alpha/beta hydrolase [Verrucomicrobiales bacterium]